MAGYKRGIYIYEESTGILPPVTVDSAMPVFLVTAPVHLAADPYKITNVPVLCHTYAEAVEAFGFSLRPEIWDKYTACEAIYSQFVLYAVEPMVMINVLDPKEHITTVSKDKVKLENYSGVIESDGILIDTVKIHKSDADLYKEETDFTLAFDSDGLVNINVKKNGSIPENAELKISYTKLAPEKVDIYDVIGGYDPIIGKNTGLELVNDVFSTFRLVPGLLAAPGFSGDPTVAAVMETKASNIDTHFRCIALCDIPTMIPDEDEPDKMVHHKYSHISEWKNENNYVSTRQVNLYPKLRLGEQIFHYSSQMSGLIGRTDAENSGVPYVSPSNKNLKINGLCYADGSELSINMSQATYLAGNGIITATNFTNGWVAWGNRTGAYPGNTDVKDSFLPIRRMFDWVGNTIVLTYWSKLDGPITRRRVATIVDSINIWLNGLTSREFILGGRVEFLEPDNPTTDLMDGIIKFRVNITPPSPARAMDFILQYDPDYLKTLFA